MKQKIKRIMELSYDISQHTEHDVIATYYGHTDTVEVTIYEGGFKPEGASRVIGSISTSLDAIYATLMDLSYEAKATGQPGRVEAVGA